MERSWGGAALALVVALLSFGCKGPEGAMGPEGPAGRTGPGGQPGAPGVPGKAGEGMPSSCLSPCHTLDGILPRWRSSGHALMSGRQAGGEPITVANWAAPGFACGNCHAVDALEQRAVGNVVTVGSKPINVQKGQLFYLNSQSKIVEASYAATEGLAMGHCTTCHKVTEDPHQTGQDYQTGSFARYWVPTGASDEAMLEKSPSPGTVTGSPAGKHQAGNTCVWCHRARRDITNGITPQNLLTNHFWGPHGSCQADIVSGKGGYHFAGNIYDTGHAHSSVVKGCVACHMPQQANNQMYADHSFRPGLGPCKSCHAGAQSFNIKDGQTTVKKGLAELQAALNAAGYLTRGTEADENDPLSTAELADGFYAKDNVRFEAPPKSINADTAGALFNYFLVARGGGAGVHQPTYAKQLLWDSIFVVKGLVSFIAARP